MESHSGSSRASEPLAVRVGEKRYSHRTSTAGTASTIAETAVSARAPPPAGAYSSSACSRTAPGRTARSSSRTRWHSSRATGGSESGCASGAAPPSSSSSGSSAASASFSAASARGAGPGLVPVAACGGAEVGPAAERERVPSAMPSDRASNETHSGATSPTKTGCAP